MSQQGEKPATRARTPDLQSRRVFMLGVVGVGAASAGFVGATVRYLIPNVLYEPSRRFTIGGPSDFPPG